MSTQFIPAGAGGAPTVGGAIPPKPTSTTLTMSQMATTVQPKIDALDKQIDSLAKEIGPASGRWNEFMVGKAGADNPQFASLLTNLDAVTSAIVRTHFGGKSAEGYIKEIQGSLRAAQSPADLKARLRAWAGWIGSYAEMTGANSAARTGKAETASATKWNPVTGRYE